MHVEYCVATTFIMNVLDPYYFSFSKILVYHEKNPAINECYAIMKLDFNSWK